MEHSLLTKIIDTAQILNSNLSLSEVLKNIVNVAIELTNAERGTFYIIDKEKEQLWSLVATGMTTDKIILRIGEGVAGWVAKTGKILNLQDVHKEEHFKQEFDQRSGFKTRNMLCYPIRNPQHEIVAVLQLLNKKVNHFTKQDEEIISAISIHCSIAFKNALIHETQLDYYKQLEITKEEAEKFAVLRNNFLTQISHEIRTPLNIIMGGLQYLKMNLCADDIEKSQEIFDMLDKGSKRITRTIDNIIALSKIKIGEYEIKNENINLEHEILQPIINEYFSIAVEKNVELVYQNESPIEEVVRDKFMIHQVFLELIDNAVKYTDVGKVNVLLFINDDGKIAVRITDSGIGISEDFLPKIFEPFTQEQSGATRRYEGNGLSLALIKKYAELNNLSITVESKKNVGSKFIVVFD